MRVEVGEGVGEFERGEVESISKIAINLFQLFFFSRLILTLIVANLYCDIGSKGRYVKMLFQTCDVIYIEGDAEGVNEPRIQITCEWYPRLATAPAQENGRRAMREGEERVGTETKRPWCEATEG